MKEEARRDAEVSDDAQQQHSGGSVAAGSWVRLALMPKLFLHFLQKKDK